MLPSCNNKTHFIQKNFIWILSLCLCSSPSSWRPQHSRLVFRGKLHNFMQSQSRSIAYSNCALLTEWIENNLVNGDLLITVQCTHVRKHATSYGRSIGVFVFWKQQRRRCQSFHLICHAQSESALPPSIIVTCLLIKALIKLLAILPFPIHHFE